MAGFWIKIGLTGIILLASPFISLGSGGLGAVAAIGALFALWGVNWDQV